MHLQVSNQVQYSMLDTRPAQRMATLCQDRNVQLLCYGTLLGGLLSDRWLNKPTPAAGDFNTVSLQKYYNMIRAGAAGPSFKSCSRPVELRQTSMMFR